ncbi:hypothetical protein EB001_19575 [bacterium]|nr:hypothetical protein [bacterium]
MTLLEKNTLFEVNYYKTAIDPNSYNKKEIMDTIIYNYEKNPNRESTLKNSPDISFHNYYGNFDNPKYKKINFTQLGLVYDNIIKNYMTSIYGTNINNILYRWSIDNINVGINGHMECHNHLSQYADGYSNQFVMIHYLSFDSNFHEHTKFENPLSIGPFIDYMKIGINLDKSKKENSMYRVNNYINSKEDDLIIFPSFINHKVAMSKKPHSNKLRVVVASSISVKS